MMLLHSSQFSSRLKYSSHDFPFLIFLIQKELANNPDCPQMCAYKLVTIKFKWWGLQSKVENFIQKVKPVPEHGDLNVG